jgi:hypothetical protein
VVVAGLSFPAPVLCGDGGATAPPAAPLAARPEEPPPPPPPAPPDAPVDPGELVPVPAPEGPDAPPPPAPIDAPPPPLEPGGTIGLAPTPAERACALGPCLAGTPEVRAPLYDPTSRILIPFTGQHQGFGRPWHVFVSESLTYDDNVFASEDDREDDWISSTGVGFTYRREGAAYWALATLSLTYSAYLDHEEENDFSGFGHLQVGWSGGAFYASIEDQVGYLQNPIVVRDDTFLIVDQDLEEYWLNTFRARAGYECCKWRAELSYAMELFDAAGGVIEAFDHTDHTVRGRFDYYLSEKTSVGAYGDLRSVLYRDSTQRDFDASGAGVTFSWRPRAKVGLVGEIGVASTDSDGGDDESAVVGSVEIETDPSVNLSLFLGWSRTFEPSLGADAQIVDIFRARAQAMLSPCWMLNASGGAQVGDTQGSTLDAAQDYTLWYFDLMVHATIARRWGFDAGWQYRYQDGQDGGIDYQQNRFTVGVSFSF